MTEEWTDKDADDGLEMDSYSHMLQRIGGAIGSLAEGEGEAGEKMDAMFAIRDWLVHVGNTGVAFEAEWNDSETHEAILTVPKSSVLTTEHEKVT